MVDQVSIVSIVFIIKSCKENKSSDAVHRRVRVHGISDAILSENSGLTRSTLPVKEISRLASIAAIVAGHR